MARRQMDDFEKIGCGILTVWVVYSLLFIAFWGVVAWGIISLVNHVTGG